MHILMLRAILYFDKFWPGLLFFGFRLSYQISILFIALTKQYLSLNSNNNTSNNNITVTKRTTVRSFAALSEGENVVVPLITDSLEWTLSSPPPLHQFTEPPLIVECEHLALKPGAEVEEILEAQGETVTDIVGKEGWVANDPKLYEGLIPQNCEWTEFIDEKTGEWVYLDEFGQRVDKPKTA